MQMTCTHPSVHEENDATLFTSAGHTKTPSPWERATPESEDKKPKYNHESKQNLFSYKIMRKENSNTVIKVNKTRIKQCNTDFNLYGIVRYLN